MANIKCPFAGRDITRLDVVLADRSELQRVAGLLEGLICGTQSDGMVNGLELALNIIDGILQNEDGAYGKT